MKKTLLVTGASRGIGLEMVRQYLAADWRVIACCRNPKSAHALIELAPSELLELDVTKVEDMERVARFLQGEPIDILMNNAGIQGPSNEEFDWRKPASWLEALQTMTLGPYLLAQALLPSVEKSQLKLIVSMSSSYGSIELNRNGDYFVYRTSKVALNAAIKCLANQTKDKGIIALALHPGSVKTDLNPTGRVSVSDSVAQIRKTLGSVTPKDSGAFLDAAGKQLPW
jgi:NAD(P)-dependent dehydrogenase (short-subunit alcohol dehydrogenase family)